jgi:O-antigen ligase
MDLARTVPALTVADVRRFVRIAASVAVFVATLAIASLGARLPLDIEAGLPARALTACVPPAAAFVAAWAVLRPWPALAVVLALTPVWDAAQVSWDVPSFSLGVSPFAFGVPPVQVILQTVFVVALALGVLLGVLLDRSASSVSTAEAGETVQATGISHPGEGLRRLRAHQVGWLAVAGLLVLAMLSTLNSPNRDESLAVLLHGIFEPVAMGALVLVLVRTRRQLGFLLIALGLAVALGGALNMIQSIPAMGSLSVLQAKRLLFSRLTFFNVGLFGEMLAMAAPLLLGAIAARRYLGLGRVAVAILAVGLAVGGASLFLTFSKSAYLATAGGILAFLLLILSSWRRRAGVIAASVALSALVIPWPALVLRGLPPLDAAYRTAIIRIEGASRYHSWDPATLAGRGSLLERFYATTAAVKMAADHPLLGIGLDQFKAEYESGYQSPQSHFVADSAHTFWPEVAAELGIPALALVVVIFASALLALWRVYRAPPDEQVRLLALTLLASLVAWLIVATAFAGDMYRPWRNMSSDFVMMAVLTAAAFGLSRMVRPWRDRTG